MSKRRVLDIEPFSELVAGQIAEIIGGNSAAGFALAELYRRRAAGEKVALFKSGRMFLVGPSPSPAAPSPRREG